jgi:hypothetical protein
MLAALLPGAALAGLGQPIESVERDRQALHGSPLAVTPMRDYDLHETMSPEGTHLRQFVRHDGTVFAVAWAGPVLPDLKLVLGSAYAEYVAAAEAHRGSHHVLSVTTPTATITVVRHPRGFTGQAHLPALVPDGTTIGELR